MKKIFLGISLLFAFQHCIAQVSYGKNPPFSVLNFNGNTISFSDKEPIMIGDNKLYSNATPVQVNGEKVYGSTTDGMNRPLMKGYKDMTAYIMKHMEGDFAALADGLYSITTLNLTIDKTGKLVYFDYTPLYKLSDDVQFISHMSEMEPGQMKVSVKPVQSPNDHEIPAAMKQKIERKLYNCLLKCPSFSPAILPSGAKAYCYLGEDKYNFRKLIRVSHHEVSLVDIAKGD